MRPDNTGRVWRRRARPLLGTLVEIGIRSAAFEQEAAFEAAFAAVLAVQRCLSRFDPDSDLSRFHALHCGQSLRMRPATKAVLTAAWELQCASDGVFDISLGTAPGGWHCEDHELFKLSAGTRLDAGGIAKGYAVDRGVQALLERDCPAGWVNAGGDLRAFGDADVPILLRDEIHGGARHFATLQQGAWATSHFAECSRSKLANGGDSRLYAHISVAAPQCLWADALTKIVAIRGDTCDPLLERYHASAWRH